jgi:hypothetical protein
MNPPGGALTNAGPPVLRREEQTFGAFFTGTRVPDTAARAHVFPFNAGASGGGAKPGFAFGRGGLKRARAEAVALPVLGFAIGGGGTTAAPPVVARIE